MNKLLGSLALSLVAPALVGQCVSSPTTATSYGGGDDLVVNAGVGIDMGFGFPFAGGTVQFIHPCTNGFAYVSDGSVALTDGDWTPSVAEFYADPARIAPFWVDLNMTTANLADLSVDTSVANQCTVTWTNVILWNQAHTPFNFQMVLDSSGIIQLNFDAGMFTNAATIVGTSPGLGLGTPALSQDLSSGLPIVDDMAYEEFLAGGFDLAGQGLQMIGTVPGYVPVTTSVGCAVKTTYGLGCTEINTGAYELFALGTQDVGASGSAITFLRTGTSYTMLDAIPGVYLAPTAGVVVSAGDDAFGAVPLSSPMPTVNGTTSTLTVCTNGYIALSPNQPTVGADYSPSDAEFQAMTEATICGPWYDWSPNVGGQIVYEEVAGIMYVTWDAVTPYASTTTDTFQYQFNLATGDITIVYDNTSFGGASGWHTPLFGYTAGSGSGVDTYDLSVDLAGTITIPDVGAVPLSIDSNAPAFGTNWDISTDNIDPISPISITFIGDAQVALPLSFVFPTTDPTCSIYINTVLGSLTGINVAGSSIVSLPIPAIPALAGTVLTAQSISLTLSNPSNIITSNGLEGIIGN